MITEGWPTLSLLQFLVIQYGDVFSSLCSKAKTWRCSKALHLTFKVMNFYSVLQDNTDVPVYGVSIGASSVTEVGNSSPLVSPRPSPVQPPLAFLGLGGGTLIYANKLFLNVNVMSSSSSYLCPCLIPIRSVFVLSRLRPTPDLLRTILIWQTKSSF